MADLEIAAPSWRRSSSAARAGPVRPRRLQGVQRRLRPPGRRRPAGAAGRAARRRRAGRTGAPTGSAATSSACVLAPRRGRARRRWWRLLAALTEHGEGFEVTTSYGVVQRADGGARPPRLASARRPAHVCPQGRPPHVGRPPVARRPAAQLSERQPDLHVHLRDIGRAGAGGRARARHGRRGARRGGPRGRAPRRRQDRHPRRDPGQARARSTRPSGASCAATRSSASASCWPRPPCAAWRAWCARATSAGTAAATRTGCAARRSRSARAWSPSATPSTR